MTDLTDQFIAESTPDPLYKPLSPTVGDITDYAQNIRQEIADRLGCHLEEVGELWEAEIMDYDHDLWSEGNQITYEWATNELKEHQLSWVRLGLVAERVRRYRIYKTKFATWRDYCTEVLGKSNWQINKIIDAATAFMSLLKSGFPILPNCVSHVESLLKCCKKSGEHILDAWEQVIKHLPHQSLLTATKISEALGFMTEHRNKLSKHQDQRIRDLADRDSMSFDDKLDELIGLDEKSRDEDEDEELDEEEQEIKQELWHQDMQELIKEHDHKLWFLGTIVKAFGRKNEFRWLRSVRCQV